MSDKKRATPLSELARAALLGAEREAVPVPTSDSPLAPFWAELADAAPEYQLLSMAGVSALYQQAGTLPKRSAFVANDNRSSTHDSAIQRADENRLERLCSTEAGQLMSMLLEANYKMLLPEYLEMMAAANLILPAEYLPNVLTYGVSQFSLRDTIQLVIGHGGRQLAAQNPRWLYASPISMSWDSARTRWQMIKTSSARQRFLRQLRTNDPELGLRILQSVWKSAPQPERVSLMRALEVRLSMADEPFLEAALDDRNNLVRKKSADLLTYMPDSRLCQRMASNTESLLEWVAVDSSNSSHEEPQQAKIVIHFPDELSPELRRDGVLKRTMKDASRRRRMELLEMVSAVPLDTWTARWQVKPEQVIDAAQQSRWPRTLTQAFAQAAERQQNLAWVDALLAKSEFKLPVVKLLKLLTPEKFDALMDTIDPGVSAADPLDKSHPLVTAARQRASVWSDSMSLRWLDRLEAQIPLDRESTAVDSLVHTATKQFARCCAPTLIDEVVERLEVIKGDSKAWTATIEQSLFTLKMRSRMRTVVDDCSPSSERKA